MSFSVQILGSSSATPTKYRNPSAQVLNVRERLFLIDCGEGTQMQMRKYGVKLQRINHVLISHLHGDHYLGLIGWISTLSLFGRTKELHIYADLRLKKIIQEHFFVSEMKLNFELIFHPLSFSANQIIYEDDKISIESFPLKHRIPCCGFVFREKQSELNIKQSAIEKYKFTIEEIKRIKQGKDITTEQGKEIKNNKLTEPLKKAYSYAYCSDTIYDEELVPYINKVDLLYHETTFAKDLQDLAKEKMHSTTVDAARIAKKAKVQQLLIGHFSARYKDVDSLLQECKEVFENSILLEEGEKLKLR
jgi:ribonuclease Z